jgi:hypothetical protein
MQYFITPLYSKQTHIGLRGKADVIGGYFEIRCFLGECDGFLLALIPGRRKRFLQSRPEFMLFYVFFFFIL